MLLFELIFFGCLFGGFFEFSFGLFSCILSGFGDAAFGWAARGFWLVSEHLTRLLFGDSLRIKIGGDFDVVALAWAFGARFFDGWAFDIWAIGADDDLNVAPVGDVAVAFLLVARNCLFERDGIRIEIFDRNIVFTGFKIGAERASSGDNLGAVWSLAERAWKLRQF